MDLTSSPFDLSDALPAELMIKRWLRPADLNPQPTDYNHALPIELGRLYLRVVENDGFEPPSLAS